MRMTSSTCLLPGMSTLIPMEIMNLMLTWNSTGKNCGRYEPHKEHWGRSLFFSELLRKGGRRRFNRSLPRLLGLPNWPDRAPTGDPPAFNAHSRCGPGSGLAQHVFRLPARLPAAKPRGETSTPRRQPKNAVRYVED